MIVRALFMVMSAVALGASAQTPATVLEGRLVGPTQMTLYVFDRDEASSGQSVCNGNCATNWPPMLAPANVQPMGDWTVIIRDDGQRQWAYKGKPLYYWAKDRQPGDVTGDGMGNVWHTATP